MISVTPDSESAPLFFRSHYVDDAGARAALAALLGDIFGLDLSRIDELGGWDRSAVPFAYFDAAGRCVANVSTIGMPLRLLGSDLAAIGIQSVAVRPPWRGHGLFRDLLEHALRWCDAHAPLVLLTTEQPALYTPFGFRPVPQHRFVGNAPAATAGLSARRLSLTVASDIALVSRCLEQRTPVSDRFAVRDFATMFLLNAAAARWQLHHLPAADAVVVSEQGDDWFRLIDVAAPRIPALAEILGALQVQARRVEVCFPPDRLAWQGDMIAHRYRTTLMARGDVALGDAPALPPTAAF